MRFEFQQLPSLLRRRIDDGDVINLMSADASRLERDEYYGSLSFKNDGVELVLKEAPWVLPSAEITDSKALHVSAFHFHREGHEGYTEYKGAFPGVVVFNDSEADVRGKLGEPMNSGGGGFSKLLKKPIAHWLRYSIDGASLNFQFDADGKFEMATLFVEEPKRK